MPDPAYSPDSDLAFGFGPQELGGDFVPAELTKSGNLLLPDAALPTFDIVAGASSAEMPPLPTIDTATLPPAAAPIKGPVRLTSESGLEFWLDGDVLLCR